MKIIMDACSVILLAKSTVLETASKTYEIKITDEVFREVMKGRERMFPDAMLLGKLHNEKKITILKSSTQIKNKIMKDFNMGEGESSTIAAGLEKNHIVATDNRQGRKAAVINSLPLIGSIEIIVGLCKRKKISRSKAIESLTVLDEEGWFDSNLIEKAKEDLNG